MKRLSRAELLFCTCLWTGASNLQVKIEGKERTYALLVADTVVVKEQGAPDNLTATCNKAWSDVAYFFKVADAVAA